MPMNTGKSRSRRTWWRSRALRGLAVVTLAAGGIAASAQQSEALVGGAYTGSFSVSATTMRLGGTITATQSAISLDTVNITVTS